MRAPTSSFRSALLEYRQHVDPRYDQVLAPFLDRWFRHGSGETCEKVWSALKRYLPPDSAPEDFIDAVAGQFVIRVAAANSRNITSADIDGRAKTHAERLRRDGKHFEYADVMEELKNYQAKRLHVMGRKRGTAVRKDFSLYLREMFKLNCGRPLDEIVRVLCEIAFNDDILPGAIRSAGRATTKAARKRRSP